ncbi:MAG: TDP-N-acetylfucosamine:lipid II N-acetylfucosaminyltransferase [Bacillota bacterium]
MKHLHIWQNEKFTEPYIKFINKHFDSSEHLFIIVGPGVGAQITPRENVLEISRNASGIKRLLLEMYRSDKIYLHNLFNMDVNRLLFLQPWLLKKCYWMVWGADLYSYRNPRTTTKEKFKEFVRAFVIKRMGYVVTLVKGDYELAKEWYGAKGTYLHGAYINPISKDYLDSLALSEKSKDSPVVIQIGNSADPSNNHIDALNKLKNFKDQNILIYVPLSYGNKKHAKVVAEEGKKIFGDKFIALMEFLPPEEYSAYLNNIDIALFNSDRQQALGNIYALLYLNKKVYIRSDTSMWSHFKEKFDIDMNDVLSIENMDFNQFVQNSEAQNKMKISNVFEEHYLVDIWGTIFKK